VDWASEAARQAREMAAGQQQAYESAVQKLQNMGASRELAEYLLSLELRLRKLEQG